MSRRWGTAWLLCAVILFAASVSVAQTTKPAPTPIVPGQFEKQPIARAAGSATQPARRDSNAAKPAPPTTGWDTVRVIAALGLVIVVIFLLRWIAQQFFGMPNAKKSSRAVQVLSRSMVSPKQQVLLLQIGRRVIVVGDTGGQMNALDVITDPDEIATLTGQLQEDKATSTTRTFGSIFGKAQTKFDEPEPPQQKLQDDLDPGLATTQAELSSLMEKVRTVAKGMKQSEN